MQHSHITIVATRPKIYCLVFPLYSSLFPYFIFDMILSIAIVEIYQIPNQIQRLLEFALTLQVFKYSFELGRNN